MKHHCAYKAWYENWKVHYCETKVVRKYLQSDKKRENNLQKEYKNAVCHILISSMLRNMVFDLIFFNLRKKCETIEICIEFQKFFLYFLLFLFEKLFINCIQPLVFINLLLFLIFFISIFIIWTWIFWVIK